MDNQIDIKKIIIPVAGLGTRFLPLSRVVPKDFFPLVDKPVIQYIIEEVKKSGIKEVVFVISPGKKHILNYFQKSPELEKTLIKRKKDQLLKELKEFEDNVTTFISNTDDFKEYADDIQQWLEQHTDIDDIETAYWAVKGQKLAAGQSSAQGEGAKRIAQNAGGGAAPAAGEIPAKIDPWDQLVAPRTDPNRI